jgi:hypothetical protein
MLQQKKKIILVIAAVVFMVFLAVIVTQKNTPKQERTTTPHKTSPSQTVDNPRPDSSTTTDQESLPTEHTSAETHPSTNELPRDNTIIGTFGKDHGIFYSKGNELWQYTLASSTQPKLLATSKGTIKELVLSPDKKWLAYTYQDGQVDFSQLGGVAGECIAEYGTSLIVRSLTTNKEQLVAHAAPSTTIHNLRFQKDGSLFFVNRIGKMYNVTTKNIKELPEFEDMACGGYTAIDYSPDNRFTLFGLGYYEGMGWKVYDQKNRTFSKTIDIPSLEGGLEILGFIQNNQLLAYRTLDDDMSATSTLPLPRFELYDTQLRRVDHIVIPTITADSYIQDFQVSTTSALHKITIYEGLSTGAPHKTSVFSVDTNKYSLTLISSTSTMNDRPLEKIPNQKIVAQENAYQKKLWLIDGSYEQRQKIDEGMDRIMTY